MVTAKLMYHYLANCFLIRDSMGAFRFIWDGKMSIKIKCFGWLCLANKILNWEALQKRGFIGPGWCCLCHQDNESIHHIFGYCAFYQTVWARMGSHLSFLYLGSLGCSCLDKARGTCQLGTPIETFLWSMIFTFSNALLLTYPILGLLSKWIFSVQINQGSSL